MCILDRETGKIRRMVAAHDVGKAVNPLSVEGQIEGGVVMSMGYALTEQYPIDENCRPTAKYGTLGLFRANQLPEQEIEAIVGGHHPPDLPRLAVQHAHLGGVAVGQDVYKRQPCTHGRSRCS